MPREADFLTPPDDRECKCPECSGSQKISDCCNMPVKTHNGLFLSCSWCGMRLNVNTWHYCKVCDGEGSLTTAQYHDQYDD